MANQIQNESILSQDVGVIDGDAVSVRISEAFLHNDKMQFQLKLERHVAGSPTKILQPVSKTITVSDQDYTVLMAAIMAIPEVANYLQGLTTAFIQEVYPNSNNSN